MIQILHSLGYGIAAYIIVLIIFSVLVSYSEYDSKKGNVIVHFLSVLASLVTFLITL